MRTNRAVAFAVLLPLALLAGCTGRPRPTPVATSESPSPSASPSITPTPSPSPSPTPSPSPSPTPSPSLTGYAGLPAAQIVADMTKAVGEAQSVHYAGMLDQGAKPVNVNVTVGRAGTIGVVDFGTGRIDLLAVNGVLFIRAGAGVWKAQGVTNARALTSIVGKWVQLGAADAARFRVFIDIDYLLQGFEQPRYAVTGTVGSGALQGVQLRDGSGTVLTVAATAPHFPLSVRTASGFGALTFTNWNEPVKAQNPVHFVDLTGR